jgi:DNA segregation ATPase FtsK/SpoIIIE-like protein
MRAAAVHIGQTTTVGNWHDELRPVLSVAALTERSAGSDRVPFGRIDRPKEQHQGDFDLVLGTGGLLLVGAAGTERTTALRTIATSAARAGDIALYVVDSQHAFRDLAELDQCGAVVAANEPWRMARLFEQLGALTEQRRNLGPQRTDVDGRVDQRARADPDAGPVGLVGGGVDDDRAADRS